MREKRSCADHEVTDSSFAKRSVSCQRRVTDGSALEAQMGFQGKCNRADNELINRQQEGTDVRDGRSSRPKLSQRHDVLEGDVRLRADIRQKHVLRRAAVAERDGSRGSGGGSSEDLDDDGVSPDGLRHCLLMVDLGEVAPVHLGGEEGTKIITFMLNIFASEGAA
ncbi:hypothetical protein EYF80_016083 [Liparis tanakae]|uniref:Uncharacterized protein n=1 Tax=Liparis tanakae TaxID=230148 RepID=A0A4Z2I9A4_9TELE|nr:hypothetical protein EYF80_016083 [Liparis tanakae]